MLRKDKALAWELAQIEASGPNWRDAFEELEDAAEAGMDMGAAPPMGGPPMGGPPPDFGPAPPIEGAPPAPAPVPGGETALPPV